MPHKSVREIFHRPSRYTKCTTVVRTAVPVPSLSSCNVAVNVPSWLSNTGSVTPYTARGLSCNARYISGIASRNASPSSINPVRSLSGSSGSSACLICASNSVADGTPRAATELDVAADDSDNAAFADDRAAATASSSTPELHPTAADPTANTATTDDTTRDDRVERDHNLRHITYSLPSMTEPIPVSNSRAVAGTPETTANETRPDPRVLLIEIEPDGTTTEQPDSNPELLTFDAAQQQP